jgi:uncharacterized coiled-coil protein SlyX
MSDDHEVRELRRRLKRANTTMGRQGRTIADLRGQLARVREDHSKLDRGELRRLERFEEMALEQFALDKDRLDRSHEEIKRLHEKLDEETDS